MRLPFTHLYNQARRNFSDPSVIQRDILYLSIKAGGGGHGLKKYNGIGGNGASVYLKPLPSIRFSEMCEKYRGKRSIKSQRGVDSAQLRLIGKHGEPVKIAVPLGVECLNADTKMLIARCTQPGIEYLIAQGGAGGTQFNTYRGQKGAQVRIAIHFKLTTNVGFVGLPNAGKSTLLKALVPTKNVKIADYPFTTLKPQVLDVKFEEDLPDIVEHDGPVTSTDPDDAFSMSVADLPGIIEGASRNRGRGYEFLKHLEYSEIVIMVVDVHGFKLSDHFDEPFRNAIESIAVLTSEMEKFDKRLVRKPTILVLNKTDLQDGKQRADDATGLLSSSRWIDSIDKQIRPNKIIDFEAVLALSAKDGEVKNLKRELRKVYNKLHPIEALPLDDTIDETDEPGKFIV